MNSVRRLCSPTSTRTAAATSSSALPAQVGAPVGSMWCWALGMASRKPTVKHWMAAPPRATGSAPRSQLRAIRPIPALICGWGRHSMTSAPPIRARSCIMRSPIPVVILISNQERSLRIRLAYQAVQKRMTSSGPYCPRRREACSLVISSRMLVRPRMQAPSHCSPTPTTFLGLIRRSVGRRHLRCARQRGGW